jgi:integrase
MSTNDSTAPSHTDKPNKPYPDFPLFPHATKRWAKKIRGKMHYFGPWGDPDGALKKYEEQKSDLHAGKRPREVATGVTVKDLANAFLTHKSSRLESGDISPRTWKNYKETADLIVAKFGKARLVADLRPDDFAELRSSMSRNWGPVRVRNYIQQIRSVFKFGFDSDLLSTPMRFGSGFTRPSQKTLRLEKEKSGPKIFEADEIRKLVNGATVAKGKKSEFVQPSQSLKAMIFLGVNCGFGNSECGTLPRAALDLEERWCNYHRPKTGITRRCPLWPETVEALKAVLADRREPKDKQDDDLVFVTRIGLSWYKDTSDNPISKEMRKLLDALGINGNRNFYALRHTFETIGGESQDKMAVDHIMGLVKGDALSLSSEPISDERLKAVSDYVWKWLFDE